MQAAGLTWTEATSLKRWEAKAILEHIEDQRKMARNRARVR